MVTLKTNDWIIENVDTVLFDKDGTLIDLHFFWGEITQMRALEIIKRYNLPEKLFERFCAILGYNINSKKMQPDGITALYSRVKIIELFSAQLKDLGINIEDADIEKIFDLVSFEFNKNLTNYIKPINEAILFVKELKKLGLKTGIVTSDSLETTNLTIKALGWENLFDVVIGRESSSETKESGVPTKIALKYLDSSADKTIMIGDAPMDSISAKNAGIDKTILLTTGQLNANVLSQFSPFVLDSLKEIKCLMI